MNFKDKTIALITYSAITREGDSVLVGRAFGSLIDELAKSFKKIIYVAAEAKKQTSLYKNGTSIYSYSISSCNVVIKALRPTNSVANPFLRIRRMIYNQMHINKIINASNFIYIFMPGYTGLLAAFICIMKKKPYFLYFGADWNETARFRLPQFGGGNILNRLALWAYSFFENLVVKRAMFSLAAGKKLAAHYAKYNPNIFETVPMVQFQKCETHSAKQFGSEYGADRKKINILCVGNVQERKGTIYVLKALSKLKEKEFSVNLHLVGAIDETYLDTLFQEMNILGLRDDVDFAGYVNDVEKLKKFYEGADYFVLPTLGEGFPRVLYEAMMSGVPVVASDIGSIRENTKGTDALTLVPPANSEAIAKAVEELIRNDALRSRRIEAGYKFAKNKFYTRPSLQVIQLLKEHGESV